MQESLQTTAACRSVKGRFRRKEARRITDAHADEELVTLRLDSEQHLSLWMEITLSRTQLLAFLQEK